MRQVLTARFTFDPLSASEVLEVIRKVEKLKEASYEEVSREMSDGDISLLYRYYNEKTEESR